MNLFENEQLLSWINEPVEWLIKDGGLEVVAPQNSNYFCDEKGPYFIRTAPYLYTVVEGDFSIVTRVSVDMIDNYDSACLMMMVDENNWAKLCYEYWLKEPSIVSVVNRIYSDDCPSYKIDDMRPFLCIQRSGNNFGFHYSIDGKNWIFVRYFNMEAPSKIKVGVAAQCPTGSGCKMHYDFLHLEQKTLTDAKNVNVKFNI